MDDSVRVTVEANDESEVVRVRGSAGEVTVGGATVRFDVGGEAAVGESDDEPVGDDPSRIASVDAIPESGTLRFEARSGRRGVEGILQRTDEGVLAWRNSCPHEPEVQLDQGLGALVDGGQLVCHKHGARFDCDDGYCTRGPCRGQSLDPIGVDVRHGDVYLTDERFDAGGLLRP